jgi:hypothetical protein
MIQNLPFGAGRRSGVRGLVVAISASLFLGACTNLERKADSPEKIADNIYVPQSEAEKTKEDRLFGAEGLQLFGSGDDLDGGGGSSGIGVNGFLWRASLDTVSFMPLASADPFGGVIITEWYAPPESPGERFKMTVYILDRRLRADGIKVALFRQRRDGATGWIDASTNPEARTQLEDAILTRARELKINSNVE